MSSIVIYCRSGFESDAAAEINHYAAQHGVGGYVKAKPNTAFITFECFNADDAEALAKKIDFKKLVFARQWFVGQLLTDMPVADRVSVIKEAVTDFPLCGELRVETPIPTKAKSCLSSVKVFHAIGKVSGKTQ